MQTITVTFGDVAENHIGMQKIGVEQKIPLCSLSPVVKHYRAQGFDVDCYLLDENGSASVIVVRSFLASTNQLVADLKQLDWDKKMLSDGKVLNKRKRYNLCFADFRQEPNYEEGEGRVVCFADILALAAIRDRLENDLYEALAVSVTLVGEGNYYYNKNCSIGYHGDAERNIVIGLRLGDAMKLLYRWYHMGTPISEEIEIKLESGDLYYMSERAIGKTWKTDEISLRHSARY